MSFIITDWAGNVCFQGKEFPTFDDAWNDFLYPEIHRQVQEESPQLEEGSEAYEKQYNETAGEYFVVNKEEREAKAKQPIQPFVVEGGPPA